MYLLKSKDLPGGIWKQRPLVSLWEEILSPKKVQPNHRLQWNQVSEPPHSQRSCQFVYIYNQKRLFNYLIYKSGIQQVT